MVTFWSQQRSITASLARIAGSDAILQTALLIDERTDKMLSSLNYSYAGRRRRIFAISSLRLYQAETNNLTAGAYIFGASVIIPAPFALVIANPESWA
ncbi:TPA: hypothetical protein I8Y12_000944 [Raoultella planticola]|nr:hypothetical protein [Raoultella planticola]